jgi:hypothetical protein
MEGLAMKKLLERQKENVEISIAYDPVKWGAWKTYRIALDIEDQSDWLIFMEDDVSFPVDVLQRIDHVLNFAPKDAFVFFYVPTNGEMINAFEKGNHVSLSRYNFWPQCTAIPLKHRKNLLETIDDIWQEDSTSGDGRLKKYMHVNKCIAYTILPSIFQHLGTWRSSLGYMGKVGKFVRQSFCFNPAINTYSIDWDKEFKNPYIDKMPKGKIGFEHWKKGMPYDMYNDGGQLKNTLK